MKIKLHGLKDVQRKLQDWEDSRIKALRKHIQKSGKALRREARRRAPVKTGTLRKSIHYAFKQSKRKGMGAWVRGTVPYSHIVEYGSAVRNIPPRPFMQPAYDSVKGEYMMTLEYIMGTV